MTDNTITPEQLTLSYIPLSTVKKWNRNKKKHDIGGLIQSIRLHGFKDPLKFEPQLNNGSGGIVEGNGRDEALDFLYKEDKDNPPRGIILKEGDWLVPILFGVDASSQQAAEAYGYDHNNLTILGGDFSITDLMRMYDTGVDQLLVDMMKNPTDIMPVTVDLNTASALENIMTSGGGIVNMNELWEGMPEFNQQDKTAFKTLAVHFPDQAAVDKFSELIGQKVGEKTRALWFPDAERLDLTSEVYKDE